MLSTISSISFPSDPTLGSPFKNFETGFTPWDDELFPSTPQSPKPVGSTSGSGEIYPFDQNPANSNSGLDDPNQPASVILDERKRRRMISNRESARRSRMRKQRHLENLRNQVNRLRVEKRDLTNRLRYVLYHAHYVRTDNDRLRSEHSMLLKKLLDMRQIMMFRQLQQFTTVPPSASPSSSPSIWACNNIITEQNPSLITS